MVAYKCKMCGGNLNVEEGAKVAVCEYCQTQQTIPSADDEKKANLYNRANHFRQNGEFDKAMSIYEHILDEDETDSEAYWSIVLCRYGIEYVEDPSTLERKPTVNRVQSQSILQDADYLTALEHADYSQKVLYEQEATAINEIQKEILQIAAKEKPYDIFLSYKEKAPDGQRTKTSVIAQDLYQHLTKEGYRVFFSRISLEDKVGQKYEPYIYSALNSAKVMLVLGMNREEYMAPWVKNEWSRFLNMMKENPGKVLIPCFRDITIDELPDEFQILQSQDLGRIGAEQDILRGLSKIFQKQEAEQKKDSQTVEKQYPETENSRQRLLQNAETYIRLKDYEKARGVYQKITELYPEDYSGWWGLIKSEITNFLSSPAIRLSQEVEEKWEKWFSYVKELAPKDVYEQKLRDWLLMQKNLSYSREELEQRFLTRHINENVEALESLVIQRGTIGNKIEERENLYQIQEKWLKCDKPLIEEQIKKMKNKKIFLIIGQCVGWPFVVIALEIGALMFAFKKIEVALIILAIAIIAVILLIISARKKELGININFLKEQLRNKEQALSRDQQMTSREIVNCKQERDIVCQKESQINDFISSAKCYLKENLTEVANLLFIEYCTQEGYNYQEFVEENERLNALREEVYRTLDVVLEDNAKRK